MFTRIFGTATLAVLVAALALAPTSAQAKDELPSDLAMVPGDAAGFVHIRLADIWKHDMMKGMRDTVQSAGIKALTAFEKQVYPSPSTIDRATIVVLAPKEGARGEPVVVGIVRFSEAFDSEKIVKLYVPNAVTAKANGKTLYGDKESGIGIHFPDDKHLIIGPAEAVEAFISRPPVLKGGITSALQTAASGMTFVAAVNVRAIPIPPQAFKDVPENLQPLLKAERIVLTLDMKPADPVLTLRAGYAGETSIAEAEEALKAAAIMAKAALGQPRQQMENTLYGKADAGPRPVKELPELFGALVGLGGMNQLELLLNKPPIKRDGNDLTATVTIPKEVTQMTLLSAPVAIGLLLPAVQKVREAAARTKGQNNLKQIGLAMHNYHDTYNKMPSDIYSKDGKPLLSWRVAILPYIEQDALYRQFKLDEPWDSEHNKKFSAFAVNVYIVPSAKNPVAGKTHYQGFISKKGAMPRSFFSEDSTLKTSFANITDGTSNTIMVAEAAEAVDWAKPADMAFDAKKPLPKLGGHSPGGYSVLMGDGSVRFIRDTVNPKTLLAAITIDGGEVFNIDD